MLRKKAGSTPKPRSKAGESCGLVPVARELCDQLLLGNDPVDVAVKSAASLLDDCYSMLSVANFCHDSLKEACRTFCLLYTSLEAHVGDGVSWAFKPKFHIWQELCELSSTCPSTCWTYRDEDFGGSVGQQKGRQERCSCNFSLGPAKVQGQTRPSQDLVRLCRAPSILRVHAAGPCKAPA